MPMFPVPDARTLSDYIIPLTPEGATAIFDAMGSEDYIYAAVYGIDFEGKPGKWAIQIAREDGYFYVHVHDYHPRNEGRAQVIIAASGQISYSSDR